MVRSVDVDARNLSGVADGITNIYDDTLDVIVVRGASSPSAERSLAFSTTRVRDANSRADSSGSSAAGSAGSAPSS